MTAGSPDRERIDFVVGAEIPIRDMLAGADPERLLSALVAAGAERALLSDESGRILWCAGGEIESIPGETLQALEEGATRGGDWRGAAIRHEGETRGYLHVTFPAGTSAAVGDGIAHLAAVTIDILMRSIFKRLLTTQAHTTTVQQSYDDLLRINRDLKESRDRYEDLSKHLQQRVDQRTRELHEVHTKLIQKEKMASIGQLAAGVAHEVNTPLNYVSGNLRALAGYVERLHDVIRKTRLFLQSTAAFRAAFERIELECGEADVAYIASDTADLVRESLEGTDRIARIVSDLKGFSHVDDTGSLAMDLNEEIERALRLLSQTRPHRSARVVTHLGALPPFQGHPALLSQVFFSILTNAFQSRGEGLIVTVETRAENDKILISMADNGSGIAEGIRDHIFDPFFSTREVGQGTGMGLTVAWDIVTNHGGTIRVDSAAGSGTTVYVALPAQAQAQVSSLRPGSDGDSSPPAGR